MIQSMTGDRVYIRRPEMEDLDAFLELRLNNRAFLKPIEPRFPERHFTEEGQREAVQTTIDRWERGTGFGFGIFLRPTDRLIGRVNLSNIVRGAWQNCTIGYFLDQQHQGKGYMTEAVRLATSFAFQEAELHRIEASVMPRNRASIRVVERTGFRYIGLAKQHLKINGKWEDHHLYALTAEMAELPAE
ncbi:ribosomal-protein-alanine N-acetyltransferase [Melghirimyces profundicolus]|uniref:Ribosomal-protein-alanine N-acetyltransferase n=1 Tax=Melghirimyces profundicolus TaxID=1242148 RepID=A0A2T6C7N8_9BACL|nr:GNAT family protein [Melghirimyces profundicolus]PTX64341.1 ribosomal-protein-alanine N-acetyltransferase [Melghirimyces profundicolus]